MQNYYHLAVRLKCFLIQAKLYFTLESQKKVKEFFMYIILKQVKVELLEEMSYLDYRKD